MGVLDKLMFWKRSDDLPGIGKGADLGFDAGLGANPGMPNDNLGLPPSNPELGLPQARNDLGQQQGFGQQTYPPPQQTAPVGFQSSPVMPQQPAQQEMTMMSKDLELLSYKLDTLKAAIDMVNQRLANIERLATGEQERKRRW